MSCRYLTIIIAFNALAGYSAYADVVPQTQSTAPEKSDEPTTSPAVEGEPATLSTEKTLPSVEAPAETAEMPPPPEEKPSPCARVTCSDSGVCVLLEGRPSCACYKGYMPDAVNGLSCIPVRAQTNAEREPVGHSSVEVIDALVPNLPTKQLYHQYLWRTQLGRFNGTFPEFVAYRLRRKKIRGALLISGGGLLTALAAVSFAFGIVENNRMKRDDGDCIQEDFNGESYNECASTRNVLYITGAVSAAGAAAMYTVGGVIFGKAASRLRLVRRLQASTQDMRLQLTVISPYWQPDGGHGVAARIRF